MSQGCRVLARMACLRSGCSPSSMPGPASLAGTRFAKEFAPEPPSLLSPHPVLSSRKLRYEHTHNTQRRAQSICRGSYQRQSGLPVLRRSAHQLLLVTVAGIQTRACAPWRLSSTPVPMQLVSSSMLGSASQFVAQAHLRRQCEPNPSVKRTA
jgi:hypothetical protein